MKSKFIRNTAKIVVEKDKLTGRIRSFVMIFIGSYDYLKKTKSMEKNTYLYRQPDFDGSVLFYEINGTFINGWKYEKGKIVASIAPKIDEENGGPKENNATSRAIVEDCTDYCYTVYDEECYEETWYDYDDEYGWKVGVTYGCYTISWEECTTHCTYYDDGSDDEDDNWDEDFPAGGSNTSNNTGKNNNDNDEKVDDRETLFEESMKEVKVILKNLGIDVDQYTIKLNTEMCGTNARVMNDGTTIELCTRALTKYTHNDQASIIWHEIYHVDHGHYEGINPTTPCDPPLVLKIDDEIQPYFELYLNNEYDGYGTKEDYALGMLLTENALHTAEWYENEIETYNAELDNNIPRSENYEADMHFCLWKYQQIYEYLTKE